MKTTGIALIVMAWAIYFKFPPSEHIWVAFLFLFLCGLGGGLVGKGIVEDLA